MTSPTAFPLEEVAACPLCNHHHRNQIARCQDLRFGYPGEFNIFECQYCGLLYLGTRVQEDFLGELYTTYYLTDAHESPRAGFPARQYVKNFLRPLFPDTIPRNDIIGQHSILEIGPGVRPVTDRMGSSAPSYGAIEFDGKALALLRQRFGSEAIFSSFEEAVLASSTRSYACCVADQVIEHSYRPTDFLTRLKTLLAPNATIILATPNADSRYRNVYGDKWIGWHAPYHSVLFNPRSMRLLAESCGLSVRTIATFTPGSWLRLQRSEAGMRLSPFELLGARIADQHSRFGRLLGDNLYCVLELA